MAAEIPLIINADDFGYFDAVSIGILDAGQSGAITATGVIANGHVSDNLISALRQCGNIDAGVHLNATMGTPLTRDLSTKIPSGQLPSKLLLAHGIVSGAIPVTAVIAEWRAQIERCLKWGLTVHFLNSHEHVHMLPMLFPGILGLANEFEIRHVRHTLPEWDVRSGVAGLGRSVAIAGLLALGWNGEVGVPRLLGLSASGNLNLPYIRRAFGRLKADGVYELMCHPGRYAPQAPRRLRTYHNWEGELALLLGHEMAEELDRHSVRLIRFRDLPPKERGG
jgi:predicted glycoside hydrolase/deacetylase ChbG (UPF0249 family)